MHCVILYSNYTFYNIEHFGLLYKRCLKWMLHSHTVSPRSGGSPSQTSLRRGAPSTWWATAAPCTQWAASPWFRWRTRRWLPQRSLTSGSKSSQLTRTKIFKVLFHCLFFLLLLPEIWFFSCSCLGTKLIRSSGVACWGKCVTLPAPPVCPCASTLPGCPNCRQNLFLSLTSTTTPLDAPPPLPLPILLPQRAASEVSHTLYSDFCVSSWSLTLIFLWTQMIFICTINARFCCLLQRLHRPCSIKKKKGKKKQHETTI